MALKLRLLPIRGLTLILWISILLIHFLVLPLYKIGVGISTTHRLVNRNIILVHIRRIPKALVIPSLAGVSIGIRIHIVRSRK